MRLGVELALLTLYAITRHRAPKHHYVVYGVVVLVFLSPELLLLFCELFVLVLVLLDCSDGFFGVVPSPVLLFEGVFSDEEGVSGEGVAFCCSF